MGGEHSSLLARDGLHESLRDVLTKAWSRDNRAMKQSSLGLSNTVKRTRKREFLDAMELVVPWAELVALIAPYAPESGRRGQQPFAVQTLLRIHFMPQWFKLSDPAMEEALHDVPAFRDFAGLSHWDEHIPSESSILRLRHLLERHKLAEQILATVNALLQAKGLQLKAGTVVDATLIAAPSSTKNQSGERDPWAAAGSVDTDLSFLSFLELYGTEIAERRMPARRVVEALDVVEHI